MPVTNGTVDLSTLARDASGESARVARMASGLVGSEILRIAAEVRARKARGEAICDLTVGDFDPRSFPVPDSLREALHAAIDTGETNYPPSSGLPALREAVRAQYASALGLDYPVESVLVAAGARPLIYALYRAVCDPGDRVVYPVPSWNNNHYTHLVGGVDVPVACHVENRFLPTREDLAPHLRGARLLSVCSPLNPTGTAFSEEALRGIAEEVLAENRRREGTGERPLYLLYDQVYWMLRFGGTAHLTPVGLLPELARYTVMVDGISKSLAATGLRVGYAVGPVDVIERMSALNGHVGAWAPRPEQVATARALEDPESLRSFHEALLKKLGSRLALLHSGFQALKAGGLPVDSIAPMGALYLAARIHPFGSRTADGQLLATNEEVRSFVLASSQLALVPFQAFGATADDGWFRLSVGVASEAEIAQALPRLERALSALS